MFIATKNGGLQQPTIIENDTTDTIDHCHHFAKFHNFQCEFILILSYSEPLL